MPLIRVSDSEGKPHSTKAGRRAESQRAYKRQFGGSKRVKSSEPSRNLKKEKKYSMKQEPEGYNKGGHVKTSRENRLEELGRVDAEKAYTSKGKRNLRDEKHRIRTELKSGGPAGKTRGKHLTGDDPLVKWLAGGVKGKPHSSKEGREAAGGRKFDRLTKRMRRPSPGPQARPPRKSDYKSPGRPGGKGPKPDKRPKKKYMTPLKSGGKNYQHGTGDHQT